MKTAFILLFIMVSRIGNSQEGNSYIEYHKKCRKAEQLFLKDITDQCFELYNQIFDLNDSQNPQK
ncbi:hypothetical protein ERX46_04540 [Brumimicrobium glaciale]|uniref:Uncharacterized protein n=1 Tax=Brumimicrobium glaciale TaxID=200475 RepID=A0A4Q4KNC2_9FLAO|nr:hypothetical protein [Brumimicrobium glaciale]RYM34648.1 hypothetical protein ERX46_04540 [Brumimicrobium glaciale]